MTTISIRLPDDILNEVDKIAKDLTQLPQLSRYFDRKLLILLNPKKKVVTTNYVSQTSLVDSF
jgi:hypothetical protein